MSESSEDPAVGELIELGPDDYLQESASAPEIVMAGSSAVTTLVNLYDVARRRKSDRAVEPEPPKLELPPGVDRDDDRDRRRR